MRQGKEFDIFNCLVQHNPIYQALDYDGIVFESKPLSLGAKELLTVASFTKRTEKQCYANSQTFILNFLQIAEALSSPVEVIYVEGVCLFKDMPLPIEHGWLLLDGSLVDLTLRQSEYEPPVSTLDELTAGVIPSDRVYLGLKFNAHRVRDKILDEARAYTLLFETPKLGKENILKYKLS